VGASLIEYIVYITIHVLAWVRRGYAVMASRPKAVVRLVYQDVKPNGNTDVSCGIISENSPDTQRP